MIMFVAASPIGSIFRLSVLLLEKFYPQSNINTDIDINNSSISYLQELLSPLLSVPPHYQQGFNTNDNGNPAVAAGTIEIPKGIASYFYSGVKRNITADDIMHTVFHHHAMPIHSLYPLNPVWSSDNLDQDLHMVLPWIFAFTALIVVPLSLVVFSALSQRSEMETNYKCKKIMILETCLQGFQKEVAAEDVHEINETKKEMNCCNDSVNNNNDNDNNNNNNNNSSSSNSSSSNNNNNNNDNSVISNMDSESESIVTIPKPGVLAETAETIRTKDNLRQVTGTCAICLSSYKAGETVVWSSNTDCPHAFHTNCIVTWIKKRYTSSCPCCRRGFIDADLYSKVKYSHSSRGKYRMNNARSQYPGNRRG